MGITGVLWIRIEVDGRRRMAAGRVAGVAAVVRTLVSGLRRGARSAHHISILVAACCAAAAPVGQAQTVEAAAAGPPGAYRLGVFPYLPVLTIDRIYGPVAAQFAEDLDRPVELKTKPTFESFAEELRNESYDIIMVHPFFYVEARDKHHYLPLARPEEPLTGVIMVREDNPAASLADLRGKTIALPPELAAVSKMVRASLIEAGLVPGVDVTLDHRRSKQSCLDQVAIGRADACGLPRFALAQIDPDNDFALRPMFETRAICGFVFAVHARVAESDRTNIWKSIMAWPYTAKGRRILKGGAWTRFVRATDAEYDEVRRYASRLQKFAQR